MPISYAGIIEEHRAVRTAVGMFDLSHMGQFLATGDGVGEWLDGLTVNAVDSMLAGQARYNVFTNESGGAHDDAIVYRFPEYWLIVVNAANTAKMWSLLNEQKPYRLKLADRTSASALIALQGPRAVETLQPWCDVDLSGVRYYCTARGLAAGIPVEIARTGYTGEDGFELFAPAEQATKLWDLFVAEGAPNGLQPAGLGARDVLRLEAGMPLYGHELSETITPLMAGLGWAVKFDKPAFTGKAALLEQRQDGRYDRIVGLIAEGKAPAREGYAVYAGSERCGRVQSGSPAPALGGKNIATALVRAEHAAVGENLDVEVRGRREPYSVVERPFYRRPKPVAAAAR